MLLLNCIILLFHVIIREKLMKPLLSICKDSYVLYGQHEKLIGINSFLVGNCVNIYGDCSHLSGDCSTLKGNCTGVFGDCSDICGNLDDCEITDEERLWGIDINELIG